MATEPDDRTDAERSLVDVEPTSAAHGGRTRPGSIRWQEPGTARPRKPTVAEARQRDKAQKAREAADRFAEEQERQREMRAGTRRKVLMGSVAAVGLVGAVALGYLLLGDDEEVAATCVSDGTNQVVPDNYCASGNPGVGGMFIYAGSPYRYYYGGSNGGVGSTARGGTLELPRGTAGKTSSGSSISRGGFGSSSHGSSGS